MLCYYVNISFFMFLYFIIFVFIYDINLELDIKNSFIFTIFVLINYWILLLIIIQLKNISSFFMQAIDWYLVATPLFAIFIVLTLITLKLSLKSETQINETAMKKLKVEQAEKAQGQIITAIKKYSTLKVLNYLIRNHTFIQFCVTRKSKNKLPTLLSFSIISGLCLINPSIIINCVAGIPIVIGYFITQSCFEQIQSKHQVMDGQAENYDYLNRDVKPQDKTYLRNRYLFIFCGVFTSGIYLYLCAITFKNYSNLFLSNFLKNVAVSCFADLFITRLPAFLILSFPFSCNNKILSLIENERLREIYAERNLGENSGLKDCATNLSPRKKQPFSPTKIPKAVKIMKHNSQTQALKNAMQIAKKIKKQRKQSDYLKKSNRRNQIDNNKGASQQYSINYLFQENQNRLKQNKGRQTPIASFQEDKQSSGFKTKRKDTDLVIVQFKKNDQNQHENKYEKKQGEYEVVEDDNFIQRKGGSFLHSNLDFQDDFNRRQDSQNPSQGQNRLNIIKLLNNVDPDEDEQDIHRIKRNQNFLTVDVGRNDHLHICENNEGVIQLDSNSPQRRRNRPIQQEDGSQFKLKKKGKHFSGNSKRRVIKFSSGEPYLQYLPHMLQKNGSKHKKSQPLQHSKVDLELFEGRKSIKKHKTKKQPKFAIGDENNYPGTMEALEVQDI